MKKKILPISKEYFSIKKLAEKSSSGTYFAVNRAPRSTVRKIGNALSLYVLDGTKITRRSTYYSGILAWAGIVTIHKSEGKGSYITVNPKYRNI